MHRADRADRAREFHEHPGAPDTIRLLFEQNRIDDAFASLRVALTASPAVVEEALGVVPTNSFRSAGQFAGYVDRLRHRRLCLTVLTMGGGCRRRGQAFVDLEGRFDTASMKARCVAIRAGAPARALAER